MWLCVRARFVSTVVPKSIISNSKLCKSKTINNWKRTNTKSKEYENDHENIFLFLSHSILFSFSNLNCPSTNPVNRNIQFTTNQIILMSHYFLQRRLGWQSASTPRIYTHTHSIHFVSFISVFLSTWNFSLWFSLHCFCLHAYYQINTDWQMRNYETYKSNLMSTSA